MSSTVYLVIMVGVMVFVTVLSVPSLFTRKCPKCGMRNRIEADRCRNCQTLFLEDR